MWERFISAGRREAYPVLVDQPWPTMACNDDDELPSCPPTPPPLEDGGPVQQMADASVVVPKASNGAVGLGELTGAVGLSALSGLGQMAATGGGGREWWKSRGGGANRRGSCTGAIIAETSGAQNAPSALKFRNLSDVASLEGARRPRGGGARVSAVRGAVRFGESPDGGPRDEGGEPTNFALKWVSSRRLHRQLEDRQTEQRSRRELEVEAARRAAQRKLTNFHIEETLRARLDREGLVPQSLRMVEWCSRGVAELTVDGQPVSTLPLPRQEVAKAWESIGMIPRALSSRYARMPAVALLHKKVQELTNEVKRSPAKDSLEQVEIPRVLLARLSDSCPQTKQQPSPPTRLPITCQPHDAQQHMPPAPLDGPPDGLKIAPRSARPPRVSSGQASSSKKHGSPRLATSPRALTAPPGSRTVIKSARSGSASPAPPGPHWAAGGVDWVDTTMRRTGPGRSPRPVTASAPCNRKGVAGHADHDPGAGSSMSRRRSDGCAKVGLQICAWPAVKPQLPVPAVLPLVGAVAAAGAGPLLLHSAVSAAGTKRSKAYRGVAPWPPHHH